MRRLRFREAEAFVVVFFVVFPDAVEDLPADFREEAGGVPEDCFPKACGEIHRDPQVIPATMYRMSFREDSTLNVYRRKLGPITAISSSARLRTISACR
jgi:hypothetical protein